MRKLKTAKLKIRKLKIRIQKIMKMKIMIMKVTLVTVLRTMNPIMKKPAAWSSARAAEG